MTKMREDAPSDSDIKFLKKVADEMNRIMGLEPEIELDNENNLEKTIRNESKEIDLKEDEGKFSNEVEEYFKAEGLWPGMEPVKNDSENNEPITAKKGEKKVSKKKTAVINKKKDNVKSAYTRSHALVDAIKKGGTRKDIIELSNQLYVKKGGMDKINIATNCFSLSIPVLIILGVIEKKNNEYQLTK